MQNLAITTRDITDENSVQIRSPLAGDKLLSDKELYRLCREYGKKILMWRRKFVSLLPEVEKRQLYKRYGFYSIFEFAARLGGLGQKTVKEVLRTYSKVEETPLLKAGIERWGWGKVRAVTPLLGNVEEKDLVHMVESMPKSALEVAVREIRERKDAERVGVGDVEGVPPGWRVARQDSRLRGNDTEGGGGMESGRRRFRLERF